MADVTYEAIVEAMKLGGVGAAAAAIVGGLIWLLVKCAPTIGQILMTSDQAAFRKDLLGEVEKLRAGMLVGFRELHDCREAHATCEAKLIVFGGRVADVEQRILFCEAMHKPTMLEVMTAAQKKIT